MRYLLIFLLSMSVYAENIKQENVTHGPQAHIFNNVYGDVNVEGVPQSVVDYLIADLKKKDFALEDARKALKEQLDRYRSLEQELEQFKQANQTDTKIQEFVTQAQTALLKGNFAEAERLAGELLEKHLENKVTQAASANFIKGQALSLQYKPVQALPHLKKAYNYRPENREYAFAYAVLLQEQRQFKQAILIYEDILQIDRESGNEDVASTLNNLAVL